MRAGMDLRAILIADCGMEHTRVALVDVVGDNEYRLVAQCEFPTTAEPPWGDVNIAIQQGIAELESSTGRQLQEGGRLRVPQMRDGQGVDAFVATCSVGGALPVLVLAVTADITAESARRVVEGTYAVPFRVVTIEEILQHAPLGGPAEDLAREPWWKLVETLCPGGVLMVGGIDGSNTAPLRTLARSLAEALPPRATRLEQEVARPPLPVVFAGNGRAREIVEQLLAEQVDLRVVDNVRPTLREEQLQPARQEIAGLYESQVLQQVAGYEDLASLAHGPVQLPYMGQQVATRFLALHFERPALSIDLGSGSTAAVWAAGEQCTRAVLGHFGLGYGVGRVLAERGVERILRWLPFPLAPEDLRAWILNRSLRPRTVPADVRDLLLQQALAREAVLAAVERLRQPVPPRCGLYVASGGGLTRAPRLAQAALVLLDALQPQGSTADGLVDLYLDRYGLVPGIGALAAVNPDAAACVLLQDGLSLLGSCIVPTGRMRKGHVALNLELEYPTQLRQQAEVRWGEIAFIPFSWGEAAHLTIKPARGVRIGGGRPGELLSTKEGAMVRSGSLGLIVDARGRPLDLPAEDEARWALLRGWMEQCAAYTAEELASLIPVPPAEEPPVETGPDTPASLLSES